VSLNGGILQLWVERLALDPAAWTAGHALQLLLGKEAPARVGRADLWELAPEGEMAAGNGDLVERFETWMRSSNLFMNPSRDKALVLDGAPGDRGAACGHVVAVERGLASSRAHGLAVGHALGGRWQVRRGTVWTLEWPAEQAEEVPALLPQAAWAKRRQGGLLINVQSQDARLYVGAWECPALPPTRRSRDRRGAREGAMAEWREECAVFGIWGADRASELAQLGLYALQHRGQESTGIVTAHDGRFFVEKGLGLVADVMTPERLARLPGRQAIGHNRYSTTGGLNLTNAQPLTVRFRGTEVAIAHNGNLVNARALRHRLEEEGSLFQTSLDTEVFLHLMAQAHGSFEERLAEACQKVQGAYSLTMMTPDAVYGLRDPHGWRPLVLGRLETGAHVLASESCALDLLGATMIDEPAPGELIRLDARGATRRQLLPPGPRRACIFEHVYFSRPDSIVFGETVDRVRRRLGRRLAEEQPADADLVMAVPDSSNSIALGYSERSGLRSSSGSSATTTSGAPSSTRPRRCATTRCGSSSTPSRRSSTASAWSWSTTRSCAARPRGSSSPWCARPARARSTSGWARRRSPSRASTASTRRAATS
jgi:amidophosphoribosyltransferase